jgi:Domain of unknown function DUF29
VHFDVLGRSDFWATILSQDSFLGAIRKPMAYSDFKTVVDIADMTDIAGMTDTTDRITHQSLLYDRDFHQWTQVMADSLRCGNWAGLDLENLVEEVESLGRQQRQELRNRLGILLGHLLKWQYQPTLRSKSWRLTLREQWVQIRFLLKDNPSLKSYLEEAMVEVYTLGQLLVAKETPLDIEDLPEVCPYGLDDAINDAFLPE